MAGGLEVSESLLIVFEFLVDFASLDECLRVLRIHLDCFVQELQSFLVFLLLVEADGYVQADLGVVVDVQLVDFEAFLELANGLVNVVFFEQKRGFFFHVVRLLDVLDCQLNHEVVWVQIKRLLQDFLPLVLLPVVGEKSASPGKNKWTFRKMVAHHEFSAEVESFLKLRVSQQ